MTLHRLLVLTVVAGVLAVLLAGLTLTGCATVSPDDNPRAA